MSRNTCTIEASTRVGKMFRSITGDYEAATPIAKGVWVVARYAIHKANRHSVRHLRKFRMAGKQTVAGLLAISTAQT